MSSFRFHPELFALRTEVQNRLQEAGFVCFADYSSVDLDHENYGFEVCGIPDRERAVRIRDLLVSLYPDLPYSSLYCKAQPSRESGWKVILQREPDRPGLGAEAP